LLKHSRPLLWNYPHYWSNSRVKPYGVVQDGDWKLIEFYEDMSVELYNLKEDLGEAHDLAEANPKKVAQLRTLLHKWRESVGAQMPTPNPGYNPQ
jgi:arylsulfatase A